MSTTTLLCATDLTAEGERAVDLAVAAAKALGGRLDLIHATDAAETVEMGAVPDSVAPGVHALEERLRGRLVEEARKLEAQRARAEAAGVPATASLVGGRPWEAIVREAADRNASLVVLGRRAGRAGGDLVGPTVDHVVRHAACPVLVAPSKERPGAAAFAGPVVVGADFSPHGLAALRAAKAFVAATGGRMLVVHVAQPSGGEGKTYEEKTPQELLREQSRLESKRDLEALVAREAAGAEAIQRVGIGVPAEELASCADDAAAAMIVVGTHGRSGLSRLFLGSTADGLLRRAHAPVLVLRDPPPHVSPWFPRPEGAVRRLSPNRILCAVDFSDPARRALEHAASLGRALGIGLEVIHVHEPLGDIRRGLAGHLPPSAGAPGLDPAILEQLERALGALVADVCGDSAKEVRSDVVVGRPVDQILDATEARDIDLIVVGTHGRGGIQRILLGSVAERLVRRAPVGVLTVH